MKTLEGPVRTGVAWFILSPLVSDSGESTQVGATVTNQGYVAINSPIQDNVMYPSVGVNSSGKAVIAFSVVGQDFFPSAACATLDAVNGVGQIVISGQERFRKMASPGTFSLEVFGWLVGEIIRQRLQMRMATFGWGMK